MSATYIVLLDVFIVIVVDAVVVDDFELIKFQVLRMCLVSPFNSERSVKVG